MQLRMIIALSLALAACGGDDPPGDVTYGVTTLVVVVNPTVNDASAPVALPGTEAVEVDVVGDDGSGALTDVFGVAVLADVASGRRTLTIRGATIDATVEVDIADRDLVEVAIAADGTRAEIMSNVVHRFGGTVIEVTPDSGVDAVNAALAESNTIVFFAGGEYSGDLDFSGSGVTLFGAGPRGGHVTLGGNITVGGSGNRIRGATIAGDLVVPGSNASVSFTRVAGASEVSGSGAVLLFSDFCGPVTVSGSGVIALDNLGMAPMAAPDGC